MFERCRFRGMPVALDGEHERVLCETHADGLRKALEQPGTFEIRWGLWPHEKRLLDEARLTQLLFSYPERPKEPAPRDWWDETEEDEEAEAAFFRSDEFHAWEEIDELRQRIAGDAYGGVPIVRVRVRTSCDRRR
jgi:hypothetical protein